MEFLSNIHVSIIKETHGVTVASFGDSLEFPAFFTPNSGYKVKYFSHQELQYTHCSQF
jgi:pseudouridine-5'-phosphate glycosidase